jgi:hypothetical protein
MLLALAFLAGCGGESKTEGDADATPDTVADTAVDETEDTPTDVPVDTSPDEVEDPAGDPVEDPVPDSDAAPDTSEDPADDTPVDPVEDPPEDGADASDVTSETTCGGTPFIRLVDKGTQYTSGACNPDGSTTEAVAAADIGGCCISVDHYCAWLNCCSTLVASLGMTTTPWTVNIVETETGAFCWCEGWFSPGFEVCGLAPGTWTVRIGTLTTTVVVP